jgi:mannose-1-phosphate guanylyltransferase/mannose-6-phosphate isomerase
MAIKITPVILCGGVGSRLWPLSRTKQPKPFLQLNDFEKSMLQQTLLRVQGEIFTKPIIVVNIEHRFLVAQHLQEIQVQADIILEPQGRNTAAAIAAAAMHANHDTILLILPSDHIINDEAAFVQAVETAKNYAKTKIITFGIAPKYAETGYGYIKQGELLGKNIFQVAQFVEKPDKQLAQEYLDSKQYLWNSGIFMFAAKIFLQELSELQPNIYAHVKAAVQNAMRDADFTRLNEHDFLQSPSISVDVAVMEKTKRAVVIPLECGWSDAGSWDLVWQKSKHDADGNAKSGAVTLLNCHNNYFHANENAPLIAAIGVSDVAVISTADAVLIANKNEVQNLPNLLAKLPQEIRTNHLKEIRPWGYYQILMQNQALNIKIKLVYVAIGEEISLQKHQHRSEYWLIISGRAQVWLNNIAHNLIAGDYIFIAKNAPHSISNIGETPLYFNEVQMGENLSEDDIIRIKDKYGRIN